MNLIVLTAAVLALGAYVCRMDSLSWRHHRPVVIVVHLAGAIAALVAGDHAVSGTAGWLDVMLLALSGGWLWISFHTWRAGPPLWAHKVTERLQPHSPGRPAGSAQTAPGRSAGRPC